MKKNTFWWFTLVELLIYVVVSVIITYGIFYVFNGVSDVVNTSNKYLNVYEQIDDLETNLAVIDSQYKNYFYATGTIFSKSEAWFQACVYTDDTNQKWLVVGVVNKTTGSIVTGNISSVDKYVPFIAQIESGALNSISLNNRIDGSVLSWSIMTYFDIYTLKMTCNKKPGYTKFDLVVLPDITTSDFGTPLSAWQWGEKRKISLSFIK